MTTEAKICGISTPEALDAAIAGGADYIGLVFCARSPRHLEIGQARSLATRARGKVRIVALTVDAADAALAEIIGEVAPDYLQLHGSETPDRVAAIRKAFARPLIKAIAVATAKDAAAAADYANVADIILFDAKPPPGAMRTGGHGRAFDWRVLDGVSGRMAFMLSGGLGPDNVADAIAATHPAVVDVSSGVETAPGIKSAELIGRFLQAVKTAKQT